MASLLLNTLSLSPSTNDAMNPKIAYFPIWSIYQLDTHEIIKNIISH